MDVRDYLKGTILLEQGEVSDDCYFVLKGCVRQYAIDEDGKEQTINFFTEFDTAMIYRSYTLRIPSDYSLACTEDSVLLVGDFFSESAMFEKYPTLVNLTHSFM
ncbi:Crp/Fnr family transcriptional regulator [Fundicoccus sp. Sow4_H7]|uniref:Crp/Fnr family transcriptional regulator n=1 Tax=Fundicoccus sp. Sow4_H7 TaxID=3438784 RepID=UPI003F8FAC71